MSFRLPFLISLLAFSLFTCVDEENEEPHLDHVEEWEEAYQNQVDGKFDSNKCSGAVFADDASTKNYQKRVSLSFDDGPHPWRTNQVLDILARHQIKASFFVQGKSMHTGSDQILRRILREGHTLANHSVSHRHMSKLPKSTILQEARAVNRIISKVGGTPEFFRFPFGDASCNDLRTIRNTGMVSVGWTVDTADWCFSSEKEGGVGRCTWSDVPAVFSHDYIGYTMSQLKKKNGGMILLHDIHEFTVGQLDGLIRRLLSEGYKFTHIHDVTTFPRLNSGAAPVHNIPAGMCEVGSQGARAWADTQWKKTAISFHPKERLSLVSPHLKSGFYHIKDRANRKNWVWKDSVKCNTRQAGSLPNHAGQCVVTSSWGTWASISPTYKSSNYGLIPKGRKLKRLDKKIYSNNFYKVNPGIRDINVAYVSQSTVRCD